MRAPSICSVLLCACAAAFAQTTQPTPRLEFEVAAIRPSKPLPPVGQRGALPPIRNGPVYFFFPNQGLIQLVMMAYGLNANQVLIPDGLQNERFDINAKAPDGSTQEQVRVMWQNLLADRFHLVFHRESRVIRVWELTVAKRGVKMLDSSLGKAEDPRASPLPDQKEGGSLWLPPGKRSMNYYTRSEDGVTLASGRQARLSDLTFFLEKSLRQPGITQTVLDKTGLIEAYDFGIQFVSPVEEDRPHSKQPAAPSIFTAVEQYLGLNLKDVKRPIEVLIIDGADPVATEN
jgi:uncharacterized protein (TIGR03435 family)